MGRKDNEGGRRVKKREGEGYMTDIRVRQGRCK